MERIVIACYRPKPKCEQELLALAKTHVPRLRAEGLVTDRAPILMHGKDGTVVEVFEWKSKAAIEAAHQNPNVLRMWEEYASVCEYIPLTDVPEAEQLFSEFTPF